MCLILCVTLAARYRARELSMAAVVALFVIAIVVLYVLEMWAGASVRQGRTSLVEKLPPDVQADIKPKLLNLLVVLAFAAVVFFFVRMDLSTHTRMGRDMLLVAGGLVATGGLAARTAWIARMRLDRTYLAQSAGRLPIQPESARRCAPAQVWALVRDVLSGHLRLDRWPVHRFPADRRFAAPGGLGGDRAAHFVGVLEARGHAIWPASKGASALAASSDPWDGFLNVSRGPTTAKRSRSERGADGGSSAGRSCRLAQGRAGMRRKPCGG